MAFVHLVEVVADAGSARALIEWLDGNGYRYPPAMGPICDEYVAQGWVFVAIKVDLSRKEGVEAQPGMERVAPSLPEGGVCTGPV